MYYKGKSKKDIKEVPFDIICNNCGSHNVTITAFDYWELQIKCETCGSRLEYGSYNPTEYSE